MHVSHETIYKTLFIPSREFFDKEALTHLRSKRKLRHGKRSTTKSTYKGIIDAKTIHERPSEIERGSTFGHWEGELISVIRHWRCQLVLMPYGWQRFCGSWHNADVCRTKLYLPSSRYRRF